MVPVRVTLTESALQQATVAVSQRLGGARLGLGHRPVAGRVVVEVLPVGVELRRRQLAQRGKDGVFADVGDAIRESSGTRHLALSLSERGPKPPQVVRRPACRTSRADP